MKNNVKPGDVIEMAYRLKNDINGVGKMIRIKYGVLQVYSHFALCRKVKGGYRECFTWHQLREGRVRKAGGGEEA